MAEMCRVPVPNPFGRVPCAHVKPCPVHPMRRLAAPPTAGAPVTLPQSDDPAGAPADLPMPELFDQWEAA